MPDAIVLCGGTGTRLKSIMAGQPKSMASIGGRPFLELLLRQLRKHNFHRVILAVGFRRELIQQWFGSSWLGMDLEYSVEEQPLGTGGALGNAAALIRSEFCLVLNGDSYTAADLEVFAARHSESQAEVSLLLTPVDGRNDHGSVQVDEDGRVLRFEEKIAGSEARHLNAGIYMIARRLLAEMPAGVAISLEKDLLPQWLEQGVKVHASIEPLQCIDIGTPERYLLAQTALANVEF